MKEHTVEEMLFKAVQFALINDPNGDFDRDERLVLVRELIFLKQKIKIMERERLEAANVLKTNFPMNRFREEL